MSAASEQPSPDGERQKILAKSPILRNIICAPTTPASEAIDATIGESASVISREILNFFGKNNTTEEVVESIIVSKVTDAAKLFIHFGFFEEDRISADDNEAKAFATVTQILVYMGFEIGDIDDAAKFLPKILSFLYHFPHFFSDETKEGLKDPSALGIFIHGVLKSVIQSGVSLKDQMSNGDRQEKKPKPIKSGKEILRRDLGSSPVNFDPEQPDIPPSIRNAFVGREDALDLPDPYDILKEVSDIVNGLPNSGNNQEPEDPTA